MAERAGGFGPVVLLGLAGAGAAAVAGTKDAASVDADGSTRQLVEAGLAQGDALQHGLLTRS